MKIGIFAISMMMLLGGCQHKHGYAHARLNTWTCTKSAPSVQEHRHVESAAHTYVTVRDKDTPAPACVQWTMMGVTP